MLRNSFIHSFLFSFILALFFFLGLYLSLFSSRRNLSRETVTGKQRVSVGKFTNTPTSTPKLTKILLTGDIMLGRTVMTRSQDMDDPVYPFRGVGERLSSADLVFVNLENPITYDCPRHTTGFKFCADEDMVKGLTFSSIDVVTLANNHTLNYGQKGFEQTKEILTQNGISYTGDNNLVIKEVNDLRFGFLGFNKVGQTTAFSHSELKLVEDSSEKVDTLLVGVHWGNEYKDTANQYQRNWARQLVENGADIIAGHHPHWVQDSEYISEKPVYYSLGNFVFDQMWSEKTREGIVVELTFEGNRLSQETFYEIYMRDWAKPEWFVK